jgi:hypothetical protein
MMMAYGIIDIFCTPKIIMRWFYVLDDSIANKLLYYTNITLCTLPGKGASFLFNLDAENKIIKIFL